MTKKLYLDAGHEGDLRGYDPGAVGNGLKEANITLSIAKYCRDYLKSNYKGISIKMARTGNKRKSLTARTNEANKWNADAYVSIHVNAGGGTGFESFVYPGVGSSTKNLQDCIHGEVKKALGDFRDRGQKQANYHVLRETKMSGCLTENLFIDTKKDANFLKSNSNLKKIGQAHAKGIAKYFGLKKKTKIIKKKTNGNTFYRVVTGSFSDRENAEKRVNELKKKGFESFIDVYKK